jgi:hypothetical protein
VQPVALAAALKVISAAKRAFPVCTDSKHGMTLSFTLSNSAAEVARKKYFIEVNPGTTESKVSNKMLKCDSLLFGACPPFVMIP